MRWSYKTIHFELKKDGLLGGSFIDDAEIEESLNDFGRSGWELVSLLDVRDGVMAVFKQPLGVAAPEEVVREEAAGGVVVLSQQAERVAEPVADQSSEEEVEEPFEFDDDTPLWEEEAEPEPEPEPEMPAVEEPEEDDEDDPGVGSIRIE